MKFLKSFDRATKHQLSENIGQTDQHIATEPSTDQVATLRPVHLRTRSQRCDRSTQIMSQRCDRSTHGPGCNVATGPHGSGRNVATGPHGSGRNVATGPRIDHVATLRPVHTDLVETLRPVQARTRSQRCDLSTHGPGHDSMTGLSRTSINE